MKSVSPRTILATLFIVAGCHQELTAPVQRSSLRTDKIAYVATSIGTAPYNRYIVSVITRFENSGDVPIYLETCFGKAPPIYSVRLVSDSTSESAFNPVWGCVGASPLTVAPGETRVDTLQLGAPNAWSSAGVPHGTLNGQLRIAYWGSTLCSSPLMSCALTPQESNAISIQIPQ